MQGGKSLIGIGLVVVIYVAWFTSVKDGAHTYKSVIQRLQYARIHNYEVYESEVTESATTAVPPVSTDDQELKHRLPKIIGIGSKKCGTEAFRTFLAHHSRVEISVKPELHFFDIARNYAKGAEYYKSLMPLTNATTLGFEKSPKYIADGNAPLRIKETYRKENEPTPKFVLLVCDPVQRAYSDYRMKEEYRRNQYHTFEMTVRMEIGKIRKIAPSPYDVHSICDHIDELSLPFELEDVVRGLYSCFLRNWLEVFPREDIVIVDGDKLTSNPGEVMEKAQRDLGLDVEFGPKQFVYNSTKGLFCFSKDQNGPGCLKDKKGRTRKVVNGTVVQPKLPEYVRDILEDFYGPFNEHFRQLVQIDDIL